MKKENNLLSFKEFKNFEKNDKPTKRTEIGGDILKEELNPNTYISAGVKLKKRGHEKRGKELIKKGTLPIPDDHISYMNRNNTVAVPIDKIDVTLEDVNGDLINLDEIDLEEKYCFIVVRDTDTIEKRAIIRLQIFEKEGKLYLYHTGTRISIRKYAVVLYKMIKKFFDDKNIELIFTVNDLYFEK